MFWTLVLSHGWGLASEAHGMFCSFVHVFNDPFLYSGTLEVSAASRSELQVELLCRKVAATIHLFSFTCMFKKKKKKL